MIINSNTDTTSKQQFLASNVFFLSKEINSIYNWYNLEQVLQDDAVIASLLGVFELRYWVSFSRGKENRAFYEEVPHIQRCFNVCFKIKKKKKIKCSKYGVMSVVFSDQMLLPKPLLAEENLGAVLQRCIRAVLWFCMQDSDLKKGPCIFYELHVDFVFPLITVSPLENVRLEGEREAYITCFSVITDQLFISMLSHLLEVLFWYSSISIF